MLFAIKLGFFSLFPYRILLILAGFLFIAEMLKGSQHLEKWKQVHVKGILMFFAFWFCYGLISLLWVKSATDGIKYLFLLAMGMFLFFWLSCFSKMDRILAFYYIWLVMTVFLMVIGFYNHFTLNHLPSSTLYNGPHYKQHYPTSVFSTRMTLRHFCPSAFSFIYLFQKH